MLLVSFIERSAICPLHLNLFFIRGPSISSITQYWSYSNAIFSILLSHSTIDLIVFKLQHATLYDILFLHNPFRRVHLQSPVGKLPSSNGLNPSFLKTHIKNPFKNLRQGQISTYLPVTWWQVSFIIKNIMHQFASLCILKAAIGFQLTALLLHSSCKQKCKKY